MDEHLKSALNSEERASFARDGFVVARNLLSRDEALAIRDIFMDQNRDGPVEEVDVGDHVSSSRAKSAGRASDVDAAPAEHLAMKRRVGRR